MAEALRHINRKSAEYHLHVHSGGEFLLAQMDARLIVQVLINIIDNAIKYTPPGSDIEIGWKRQGKWILISIADNGPGIPDEAKPHIFEMFYSASNRIADSRRSMGLGLALCKAIVNAHGGEITVSDNAPHGSVFTFSVPAGEVERMNKPLILVVEDDAPVRNLITTTLKAHDYRFLTAANGESAILEAAPTTRRSWLRIWGAGYRRGGGNPPGPLLVPNAHHRHQCPQRGRG